MCISHERVMGNQDQITRVYGVNTPMNTGNPHHITRPELASHKHTKYKDIQTWSYNVGYVMFIYTCIVLKSKFFVYSRLGGWPLRSASLYGVLIYIIGTLILPILYLNYFQKP